MMARLLVMRLSIVRPVLCFFGVIFWGGFIGATTNVETSISAGQSNILSAPETIFYTGSITPSGDTLYRGIITFGAGLVVPEIVSGTTKLVTMGKLCGNLSFGTFYTSTLTVQRDLYLGNDFTMTMGGNTGTILGEYDATLHMDNDLTMVGQRLHVNALVIDGHGNTLTIGANSCFMGAGSSSTSLTLRNMKLVIATTSPFWLGNSANSMNVILENVDIYLSPTLAGPVLFDSAPVSSGYLSILGRVNIYGAGKTFDYNARTNGNYLIIRDGSILTIHQGVTLRLGTALTRENKVYFETSTSQLVLDGCTLQVPVSGIANPGLQLKRGVVVVRNRVIVDNEANGVAPYGLILGDGSSSANDVSVKVCSGAQLVVDGFLYHNPA